MTKNDNFQKTKMTIISQKDKIGTATVFLCLRMKQLLINATSFSLLKQTQCLKKFFFVKWYIFGGKHDHDHKNVRF